MRGLCAIAVCAVLSTPAPAEIRISWEAQDVATPVREDAAHAVMRAYTAFTQGLPHEERARFLRTRIDIHFSSRYDPALHSVYGIATVPAPQDHIVLFRQLPDWPGALESTAYHEFVHVHDRIEGKIPWFVHMSEVAQYSYPFPEETPDAIMAVPDAQWDAYQCERVAMESRALTRELAMLPTLAHRFPTHDPARAYAPYLAFTQDALQRANDALHECVSQQQ